jgi:hypothetical protein
MIKRRLDPRATMLRTCRGCGCSDNDACITDAGPCCWIAMDIAWPTGVCSACAFEAHFDREAIAFMGLDRDGVPFVLQPAPSILRAPG